MQTAGVPAPGSKKEKPLQKVTSIRVLLCLARRNDAISGMIILRPILLSLHSAFHFTVFMMECECDNRPPGVQLVKMDSMDTLCDRPVTGSVIAMRAT